LYATAPSWSAVAEALHPAARVCVIRSRKAPIRARPSPGVELALPFSPVTIEILRSRRFTTLFCILALAVAACDDSMPIGPTPPPASAALTLTFSEPVSARLVACATCTLPPFLSVVAEFPVTIGDPAGPGGAVQTVETRVVNRSRGSDAGTNTRPNADFTYPNTALPARGSLTLGAGLVFDMQPPRDELQVVVRVLLTDGRAAERTSAIVVAGQ
jgi:hypothetical protein